MHGYYSVQSLCILLFWPVTTRFADHASAVAHPAAGASGDRQQHPEAPVYRGADLDFLPSPPALSLLACEDDPPGHHRHRDLKLLRNRQASSRATAWAGA